MLLSVLELSLAGLQVVLDCANGAAASVAPQLFEQLGARVIVHAAEPNGTNINDQCGALFPETGPGPRATDWCRCGLLL